MSNKCFTENCKEYYIVAHKPPHNLRFFVTTEHSLPQAIKNNKEKYINTQKSWHFNYYFDDYNLADKFYNKIWENSKNANIQM